MDFSRGDVQLSTDPSRLDVALIHRYLSEESYWAKGVPRAVVERSIAGSLCFGLHRGGAQIGFARVITDRATFAWLADVFVVPAERGKGLSKWLLEQILSHPDLQGLRRFLLGTLDAHGLYAQFGFKPLGEPGRFMERLERDVYQRRP